MTDAPTHDELPIPDYDHLPIGSLFHRIRSLEQEPLLTLLRYEQAHSNRVAVTEAVENRLQQLQSGARPSGGDRGGLQPENAGSPAGGSAVGPQTSGPAPAVDFEGVPGEPRRPHSGRSSASK